MNKIQVIDYEEIVRCGTVIAKFDVVVIMYEAYMVRQLYIVLLFNQRGAIFKY